MSVYESYVLQNFHNHCTEEIPGMRTGYTLKTSKVRPFFTRNCNRTTYPARDLNQKNKTTKLKYFTNCARLSQTCVFFRTFNNLKKVKRDYYVKLQS